MSFSAGAFFVLFFYNSIKNSGLLRVGKSDLEKSENPTCPGRKSPLLQVGKSAPNKTYIIRLILFSLILLRNGRKKAFTGNEKPHYRVRKSRITECRKIALQSAEKSHLIKLILIRLILFSLILLRNG